MNFKTRLTFSSALLLSGLVLTNFSLKNNRTVYAATVTDQKQTVKINYSGGGGVAVWNNYQAPQHVTGKYLANNTNWKSFKVATLDNQRKWYNLGGQQWIDGQYVSTNSQANNAPASDNSQYQVKETKGTAHITYSGGGGVAVWNNYDNSRKITGKYLANNTNWHYFKIATGDNKTWYNLGGNQWVDGQYITENQEYILPYTYYSQLTPTFAPSACEAASLKIAMSVKGIGNNLSVKDVIDKMPRASTPDKGFNGDPYKFAGGKFITIYPEPLAAYARSLGANAFNISGASEQALINEIKAGNPIIVACNLHMQDSSSYHVSTIVGYRPGAFLIADPYRYANESGKVFWVDMNKFMRIYNYRDKKAVVIR
ncbi:C39 family peptidase [Lactobacillus hominis]|uniref:Peptidase C39-like domain-containing protein n=1 Tax=Lactobacillus hominis DSM 23910 = CRBIP 24.179 TaxID=1423758 RepID=I7L7L6_9LACO|nr:C39 family peptidase [Lactobacillus hominis]MCT3348566.1 hypothetical protein [Lactobacillus hominis]CCI82712.1 Putative uncharacterized protein [Lactobacillus hominis DSM 23910 = CRBIP 24.179]